MGYVIESEYAFLRKISARGQCHRISVFLLIPARCNRASS